MMVNKRKAIPKSIRMQYIRNAMDTALIADAVWNTRICRLIM